MHKISEAEACATMPVHELQRDKVVIKMTAEAALEAGRHVARHFKESEELGSILAVTKATMFAVGREVKEENLLYSSALVIGCLAVMADVANIAEVTWSLETANQVVEVQGE